MMDAVLRAARLALRCARARPGSLPAHRQSEIGVARHHQCWGVITGDVTAENVTRYGGSAEHFGWQRV